ncbi:TetR family transcriptional regulator [Mycolicibacterium mucogenicum]|uniref:TetR family transcriptional regulator n=1 Tax=Mycolicibacterium mucogenicum TaxID=56689 RepID=A0A1A3GV53_MYCMU|nr:TetR/AcrR family transcriptional regulator [Mycolicibacterium mucogenicum]OBJ39927.1 TetR family transcriptional regulator [Mycolicibacterium mucogenicum]
MSSSPWTPRERELLTATLKLLQQNGYERMTVDGVAALAHASKATVYRRWPTKQELVLAAVMDSARQHIVVPDTGTFRGDLMQFGQMIIGEKSQQASTLRAILGEAFRVPALRDTIELGFVEQYKAVVRRMLRQAADRGEIASAAINEDLWDLIPGYLIYRSMVPGRIPSIDTVQSLVHGAVIPTLMCHSEH